MANKIQEMRRKVGLTAAEVARRIGMNPPAFRRYDRNETDPQLDLALKIAEVLGVSVNDLIVDDKEAAETIEQNAIPLAPQKFYHPEGKLPLYAYAAGSLDGEEVLFNAPYDYIDRPAFIGAAANAYAVRVIGDSMEPRYFAGEIVYAVRGIPPRRGDFVVVQVKGDGGIRAMVKRFLSVDDHTLRLRQYNPDRDFEIDRASVVAVDYVKGSTS